MKFNEVMSVVSNQKLTENGAIAYSTLNNPLLDLFAQAGALRPRTEKEIEDKFEAAFNTDRGLALKMLFYIGNIRGGLGERRTFRTCLKWLARNYPRHLIENLGNIPKFNRWDSVFELIGTPVEPYIIDMVECQLISDVQAMDKGRPCSLMAKWMPSINTSSVETREKAKFLAYAIGATPQIYRKMLSELRKHIRVTERLMSEQEWDKIDYEAVPSKAMAQYTNAFVRHDEERFSEYREALSEGKVKVNAATLYPYDLVKNYCYWHHGQRNLLADEQWKSLPNYIDGEHNVVVMADVSASMWGRPMETSIGLAIYFAERNKGDYHNLYMTFTDEPHFIQLREGATLKANVDQVMHTDVGLDTDLEKAFSYILEHAIRGNVKSEDMPEALVVISDMEINRMEKDYGQYSFIDAMRKRFEEAGYELPKIVLWNVEARNDTFLHPHEDVIYVSGQSPSTFKAFLGALKGETAWDVMVKTLNDPMYDSVVL